MRVSISSFPPHALSVLCVHIFLNHDEWGINVDKFDAMLVVQTFIEGLEPFM
jgi:hypothetical protein